MSGMPENSFWSKIDGVLVVNLDDRPDRWEDTQARLAELVPAGRLQRLSATLGAGLSGFGERPWFRGHKRDRTWAGRAGCVLSHRNAIELAQQCKWRSVLILEDDLKVSDHAVEVIRQLGEALGSRDCDVCYLGYTDPVPPYQTLVELPAAHSLCAVSGASTTHAYLLKDTAYDWLLERLPKQEDVWPWVSQHRAIDRWYYRNLSRQLSVCAVSPSIINQQDGFSDITQRRHEKVHTTTVPGQRHSAASFHWRNGLRHLSWRLAEPRDWLRGKIKRLRGF